MLIELRGTEFNRRTNLFRGLGRFNRGLALIGFRTTGAWPLPGVQLVGRRSEKYCARKSKKERGERKLVCEQAHLPDYMSRAGVSLPGSQHVC